MSWKKSETLIVVAMKAEAEKLLNRNDLNVLVTGIGKLNAAVQLSDFLSFNKDYKNILNLGTAGSHTFEKGSLVEVGGLYDRDVDLSAVRGPVGHFGEQKSLKAIQTWSSLPKAICGSGDHIDTDIKNRPFQIVDMEAFALAFVCDRRGLNFCSVKFISDHSDENIASSWKEELAVAQSSFFEFTKTFLN